MPRAASAATKASEGMQRSCGTAPRRVVSPRAIICATSEAVELGGVTVAPRRLLGQMLNRHLPADEPDLVFIRLEFVGELAADGGAKRLRYDIIDRFDPRTGLSAMQRTTAFPASLVAQTMARGETTRRGAVPQERCIPSEAFVAALAARGIRIDESFPG